MLGRCQRRGANNTTNDSSGKARWTSLALNDLKVPFRNAVRGEKEPLRHTQRLKSADHPPTHTTRIGTAQAVQRVMWSEDLCRVRMKMQAFMAWTNEEQVLKAKCPRSGERNNHLQY